MSRLVRNIKGIFYFFKKKLKEREREKYEKQRFIKFKERKEKCLLCEKCVA